MGASPYDSEVLCYECAKVLGLGAGNGMRWYSQTKTGNIHGVDVIYHPIEKQCVCCKQRRNFLIEVGCLTVTDYEYKIT
jgi:hypothetical protein